VINHTKIGLISLFLESAEADFVSVAANFIRREFTEDLREFAAISRKFAGDSAGLAVFSCVAGNWICR